MALPGGGPNERLSPAEIYRRYTSHPSWWTGLFSNRVAAALVWLAARIPWVTPNRVTVFNGVWGLAVAWFVASHLAHGWSSLWVAIGIELYVIFDCVDGQLARYTRRTSEIGATLDSLVDRVVHPVLVMATALWIGRMDGACLGPSEAVWVGVLVIAAMSVLFPHRRHADRSVGSAAPGPRPDPVTRGVLRRVRDVVVRAFDGMQFFFFLSLGALFGRPDVVLVGMAVALWGLALLREVVVPLVASRRT